MRFWITKNSEVPVREQLFRQVMLAILSEDLPAGIRLPSTRALARRYNIHSNTVSAAYHDLLDRGWLELRRGSGLYVRPLQQPGADVGELDAMLTGLLRAARSQGHEPEEVLHRLEQLILPRHYVRIAVVEAEPGMREILKAEMEEHLRIPIEAIDPADVSSVFAAGACLVTALATRSATLRERLPQGFPLMTLRLRSVPGSLEGQTRPAPNAIIAVVSESPEFRHWARAILIAVGVDIECLCEIDATIQNWQERTRAAAVVVADVVAARGLPAGREAKIFRVIADSCIAELKELCDE
jgi:DNA-binding transcriptional regulator YhcF (GntR family)